MLKIVLATQNEHKIYEINTIAKPFGIRFLAPDGDFGPVESGKTFEANAYIKAFEASLSSNGNLFLADDSGLCVDFLNGEPGIQSARYADTPNGRIEKLLKAMENAKDRRAKFVCSLVLLDKKGVIIHKTEGICKGKIGFEPLGDGGFGYDPIFVVDGFDKTMAQLTDEEKNLVSHRGRALLDMLIWIKLNFYDTMGKN